MNLAKLSPAQLRVYINAKENEVEFLCEYEGVEPLIEDARESIVRANKRLETLSPAEKVITLLQQRNALQTHKGIPAIASLLEKVNKRIAKFQGKAEELGLNFADLEKQAKSLPVVAEDDEEEVEEKPKVKKPVKK